jgi:hypothetical protein
VRSYTNSLDGGRSQREAEEENVVPLRPKAASPTG